QVQIIFIGVRAPSAHRQPRQQNGDPQPSAAHQLHPLVGNDPSQLTHRPAPPFSPPAPLLRSAPCKTPPGTPGTAPPHKCPLRSTPAGGSAPEPDFQGKDTNRLFAGRFSAPSVLLE